jgi:hypothetical protein
MNKATLSASTVNGVSSESIDDLLADLDLDVATSGDDEIETIEPTELVLAGDDTNVVLEEVEELEASTDADDGLDVEELEMSIERAEGYKAQDAGSQLAGKPAEKAAKAPKVKKEATAKIPRQPREMSAIEPSVFVLEGEATDMSAAELEQNKIDVIGAAPSQKKIAEKYENLFTAIAIGKQPSVYVVQAFKLLEEKKSLTSTDIVAMLKGTYSQGTAQSQAGQIMKLFEVTKIAERTKNSLALNDNSVVAAKLRKILADAAAAKAA